jgi:DNA-binding transcriptional LysR family regulator
VATRVVGEEELVCALPLDHPLADRDTILALVAAGVGVTLTLTSCQHVQQTGLVYRVDRQPCPSAGGLAWRKEQSFGHVADGPGGGRQRPAYSRTPLRRIAYQSPVD